MTTVEIITALIGEAADQRLLAKAEGNKVTVAEPGSPGRPSTIEVGMVGNAYHVTTRGETRYIFTTDDPATVAQWAVARAAGR